MTKPTEKTEREAEPEVSTTDEIHDGAARTIPIVEPVAEIERLKSELAEAEKRTLLAQADLENFRRRTRRDMQDQLRYASLPLVSEMLDSVDNLQRAIEAHQNDGSSEGLLEGVQLVAQQILMILQNHGCKRIEAVGQPFDPNLHQAVQMQASDEYPANTVIMELRSGYLLYDRVIRPAQVFVSTGPS